MPASAPNSPELAVLLAIARVELRAEQKSALVELLAQQIDWELLQALAAHHALEPLLFHHIHSLGAAGVPPEFMEALRESSKVIAGRNLLLASKLKLISEHLRARQVEHIAYRGPLLAENIYGNSTLRVFRDLDILVQPGRVAAARDALAEIGFRDKCGLSPAQQAASFRFGFEHPFTAAGGVDLDLHWRLVQRFKAPGLDMDGIWKRVTMTPLWGGEVPGLSAEDLAIALFLHAGHHGWQQLSHMTDLAQLFRVCPNLDWLIVRSHLGDSNTRRIVAVCLRLLETYWDVQVPEGLRSMMEADGMVARLADRIEAEIWPSPSPALTTSGLRWMLERSSGEDLANRLRLLGGSFFCPAVEDFDAFRLPLLLSPLYPLLRVARLAWKSVGSRRG